MVIWILNFGEGTLAVNYLIFTFIASFGMLQFVAARGRLIGLMLFRPKVTLWLGPILIIAAYAWFFTFQPDLFIPGLAGGEFFMLFGAGFFLALLLCSILGIIANRVFAPAALPPALREPVTLGRREKGQLWLPTIPTPPLVIALREASADSLDILAGELVAAGAAVLLCPDSEAEAAVHFMRASSERFHPTRRYAVGVGRGADRVLQWAGDDGSFHRVLALGPFGNQANARPGLRWLRETDYLTALGATFRPRDIPPSRNSNLAHVVYGDEDTLIPPETARLIHPTALMVAGARHLTLARMPATKRLAVDLFELHEVALTATAGRVSSPAHPIPGVLTE